MNKWFYARFGDHVERVMPLVMKYAEQEDDELKENVLQVNAIGNWYGINIKQG